MRTTLSILGAGGHGRVIADAAACQACWGVIQFFDDSATGTLPHTDWKVIGTIHDALTTTPLPGHSVIVGIGNNTLRLNVQEKLQSTGWDIATVIHPSATISSRASVERGTVIMACAVANIGARIGRACVVNTNCSIDHDCVLASGVHISPGATLAGGVSLGARCWIGAGATIIQNVHIGEDTVVGAGSTVINHMPANTICVGSPARATDSKILV